MFSSMGTVRYEERGQGYRDVEKVGKHCSKIIPRRSTQHRQPLLFTITEQACECTSLLLTLEVPQSAFKHLQYLVEKM